MDNGIVRKIKLSLINFFIKRTLVIGMGKNLTKLNLCFAQCTKMNLFYQQIVLESLN